jgi:hypothetical protein
MDTQRQPGPRLGRRDLMKASATVGDASFVPASGAVAAQVAAPSSSTATAGGPRLPNLAPAQWIWYPSERTLANTFILIPPAVGSAREAGSCHGVDRRGHTLPA